MSVRAVRFTDAEWRALKNAAKRYGITRSDIVRAASLAMC